MIPYLRLYDSSIFNYLRYEVLPLQYSEQVFSGALTPGELPGQFTLDTGVVPSPFSAGRGFILFDEYTVNGRQAVDTSSEQSSQITVVGPTSYDVDYASCRILNTNAVPTSIDYKWYYVSVIQGWPGAAPPPLPVVAVDIDSSQAAGFQLGGGSKDIIKGSVHVFASSNAEKMDLTDLIVQSLHNRSIPIGNWHEGSYLNYDGTYSGFVPTTVSGISSGSFNNVTASFSTPRFDWSEINRYRSRIDFVFEVYKG